MNKLIITFSLLMCAYTAFASAADVYICSNRENNSDFNEAQLVKIMKAENLTWQNGNPIILLIDDLSTIDADAFDEFLDMTKTQFLEFWRIKFFSGRALIPKQIKQSKNALDILSENPNSIYITIGAPPSSKVSDDPTIKVTKLRY